jgi:hypothetical protein
MSEITIYYSPFREISRNALALIRHAGIEPTIVEYMRTPPSRAKLLELAAAMRAPVVRWCECIRRTVLTWVPTTRDGEMGSHGGLGSAQSIGVRHPWNRCGTARVHHRGGQELAARDVRVAGRTKAELPGIPNTEGLGLTFGAGLINAHVPRRAPRQRHCLACRLARPNYMKLRVWRSDNAIATSGVKPSLTRRARRPSVISSLSRCTRA